MQAFDTNTLEYQYIQSLLYDTYIPTIPVFSSAPTSDMLRSLYSSNVRSIIVSNSILRITEETPNKQYALTTLQPYTFGKFYKGFTTNFINKQNYYNTALHEALGNYLRFYNDYYNIDLLPLYNCFSNRYVDSFSLPISYNDSLNTFEGAAAKVATRTLAVPVKNNKSYQIAIESSGTALNAQLAYFNGSKLVSCNSTSVLPSYVIASSFDNPDVIDVNIEGFDYTFEKYLYLFIEIPTENTSSIVILERYSKNDLCLNPTLLKTNLYSQRAFSDKLMQYLTSNAITPVFNTQTSIAALQDIMSSKQFGEIYKDPEGHPRILSNFNRGTFNTGYNSMHSFIYNTFRTVNITYPGSIDPEPIRDFMGYIDSDVEQLILDAKSMPLCKSKIISTTGY